MNNTIKEHEAQINELKAKIVQLQNELIESKELEKRYEEGKRMGSQLSAMLAGMKDGGLDEAFAEKLVLGFLKYAM